MTVNAAFPANDKIIGLLFLKKTPLKASSSHKTTRLQWATNTLLITVAGSLAKPKLSVWVSM